MGMYDTIYVNEKQGQVKLWERGLREYELGDKVPKVSGLRNYAISMNEGGYVIVLSGKIKMWVGCLSEYYESDECVGDILVFDKYGTRREAYK